MVDLPVPLAPTSAVLSLLWISQLASRNKTRGPYRLPAFCRESIQYYLRRTMGGKNSSEKSRDRNSIFDSGVCRIHAVKWLFPQEKATLDALVMSTKIGRAHV